MDTYFSFYLFLISQSDFRIIFFRTIIFNFYSIINLIVIRSSARWIVNCRESKSLFFFAVFCCSWFNYSSPANSVELTYLNLKSRGTEEWMNGSKANPMI